MIRKLWPQSILGRAVVVLVLGLVISQFVALILYSGNRDEALAALGGRQTAERIVGLAAAMEDAQPDERQSLAKRMSRHGLILSWSKEPLVTRERGRGFSNAIASELRRLAAPSMEVRVQPARFDGSLSPDLQNMPMMNRPGMGMGPGFGPMPHFPGHAPYFLISLRLSDASWLNALVAAEPPDALWRGRFLLGFGATTLITLLLAAWAIQRAVRPLGVFANAAERFGTDISAPPLPESGPAEVKRAAHAFNRMQERLKRFVDDRTRMLAAISHDLRTPITRMRLRAEFVEDDEMRAKMLADLDEMEAMIGATLAFARDDARAEPRVPLDLSELLKQLVGEAKEAGQPVTLQALNKAMVLGAPVALKRAFDNLIGNAVHYGKSAAVSMRDVAGHFEIIVEDEGAGIPETEFEQVFAPFYRVEGSRSRETGGVGLGLSVARGIVRGHGGDIKLANREKGGLRVTVSLPKNG